MNNAWLLRSWKKLFRSWGALFFIEFHVTANKIHAPIILIPTNIDMMDPRKHETQRRELAFKKIGELPTKESRPSHCHMIPLKIN